MWYSALIGGLLSVVGSFVGKALIALGISYVAYKGMDTSIAWATAQFFSNAQGLPSTSIQIMGLMQVDTAVNMLCSALVMRLTFKGMSAGVMKAAKLK